MLLGPQHCRCLKFLTLIFDFIVLFCCIFAFVLYFMYVVSCFVYVCCVISVSSYYFCFVYICMYVQGSTENHFTEWTPCRNITIIITKN